MEDQQETWECKLEDSPDINDRNKKTKNGRAGNKASPFSKLKTAETDVQCSLTLSCMKSTAGLAPPPVPFTAY